MLSHRLAEFHGNPIKGLVENSIRAHLEDGFLISYFPSLKMPIDSKM